jgi:hypothetical protein
MIGQTYLERGRPVVALTRWRSAPVPADDPYFPLRPPTGTPRNVLIRREDGTLVVRPFRGLRRP